MRVMVTGATGFLGGAVVRRLRARGDEVVALVRAPSRAVALVEAGVELATGDLGDEAVLRAAARGCDAVVHLAARYAVGIPLDERPQMYKANVLGTDRVLRIAEELGVGRVVHVSTVNAFGNTEGQVVDETHRHSGRYVSYYDETKHLAHEMAVRAAAAGQPVVVALPGAVYGPGDHSLVGEVLRRFLAGRLPALALADVGITAVHLDDAADGVVRCLDAGEDGESYVLGGQITTLRGMVGVLAALTGRRPPRVTVPTSVLRAAVPFGGLVPRMFGAGPNLAELISASDGVTYWASWDKAAAHLGYAPRDLATGLATLIEPDGAGDHR